MSKKIDERTDKVTDTKRDGVRSLSTSVANSRNRTSSLLERSPSAFQSLTPLSTRFVQKNGHAQNTSAQNNTNFKTESLNPQTLYQQNNDLLSVGSWSQPQEKHEQKQCLSYLYGNSMDPCPRHSSMAEATWVPRQQLPPYERWVVEDICDGGVLTLRGEEHTCIECTCMSSLAI